MGLIRDHIGSIREEYRERIKQVMRFPRQLDQIEAKPDVELMELMGKNSVESETYRHCVTILQLRSMERALKASNPLVWATWGLVLFTISMALISFLKK